jgi:hypothetical protein
MFSRQLAKLRHKMWVRQKPHIEYQIGLRRHPIFEPEAIGRDHQALIALVAFELRVDVRAKIVHIELRRIQHDIGDIPNRIQPLALCADRFHHRIASSHRMRPPRLREAPNQRLFVCLQKDHARWQYLAHVLQNRGKLIQPHPFAHVDHERSAFNLRRLPHQVRKSRHQLQRQVVHRVIPKILEGLQRRQLSRPGEPGQNYQLAAILRRRQTWPFFLLVFLVASLHGSSRDLLARHA